MGRVKEIRLKVIPTPLATKFVKKFHYSGSVSQTSGLHFGAFLDGKLHGVMSFGAPIDKRNVIDLVDSRGLTTNQRWYEMLELNRMAFDDYLPKYSESRCIAIAIKLIRKNAPQVKWILSYSDATQCGDGTIYRAAGFKLTAINKNSTIYKLPDGTVGAKHGTSKKDWTGAKALKGFQNRYIYILDKSVKLTVDEIPYSKIDEIGAGMYKGEKVTIAERKTDNNG